MNNVIPLRPRSEVARRFSTERSQVPQYPWQEPVVVTMETGVNFGELYNALTPAGFTFAFDTRANCVVIRKAVQS